MPCYGGNDGPGYREVAVDRNYNELKGSELEAVLCGIFTELERFDGAGVEDFIAYIDWDEVGVPIERVRKWWEDHQKEDAERRARENADRNRKQLRRKALKKLSPEERKALGLND